MTYNVHVHEEGFQEAAISGVIEADNFQAAIESATRRLLDAFLSEPPRKPGEPENLIIVLSERDFATPPQAWKLSLKTKIAVPCAECLGIGAVDSGGVTPQGSSIAIPCPSCSTVIGDMDKRTNHRPECRCDKCYADLIERASRVTEAQSCPGEGCEHAIQLRAWQEAFGTSQLTHALAANQAYGKALTGFQNDVWATLNKYSDMLGWGLTGQQPECWALLDSAVAELRLNREIMAEIRQTLRVPDDKSTTQAIKDLLARAPDLGAVDALLVKTDNPGT